MNEAETFFEQVPIETVKKLCQSRMFLSKERGKGEVIVESASDKPEVGNTKNAVHSNGPVSHERGMTVADDYSDDLKYPDWQKPLQDALLEFDAHRLQERIAIAEAAICARLNVLSEGPEGNMERLAIQDGQRLLSFLRERSSRIA